MTSNYLRVVEGLDILDNVLAPFIVRVLRQKYGKEWWSHGVFAALPPDQRRHLPHGGDTDELIRWLDTATCLKVIEHHWHDLFVHRLDDSALGRVRELHHTRNRVMHKGPDDIPAPSARHTLDIIRKTVAPLDEAAAERVLELMAALGHEETPL